MRIKEWEERKKKKYEMRNKKIFEEKIKCYERKVYVEEMGKVCAYNEARNAISIKRWNYLNWNWNPLP